MAYYTKNEAFGATVLVYHYDGTNVQSIITAHAANKTIFHLGYLSVLNVADVQYPVNVGDGVAIDDGTFQRVISSMELQANVYRINVTVWDTTNIDAVIANVGSANVQWRAGELKVGGVVVASGDGVYMHYGPKVITAAALAANYTAE